MDPRSGRHPLDDARRGRRLARGDSRVAFRGAEGSRSVGARGRRPARVAPVRSRRARSGARRAGAPRVAGSAAPGARSVHAAPPADRHRVGCAAVDRVLADRRRCPGVRDPAPVPHRRESGVDRAGHGERRRGRVPRDAGVDQPLRELAERVIRCDNARCVAHHRGARPGDTGLARTAVLGSAQSGARRRSSSTRSCSG